jgi:hypothetical protein
MGKESVQIQLVNGGGMWREVELIVSYTLNRFKKETTY